MASNQLRRLTQIVDYPMFMNSINHFRAIAIVIIVAGHVYGIKGSKGDNIFDAIFINLALGGTALFVFISGFLFFIVFFGRNNYRKFVLSKAKNLLIPYTFLSIVPIFLALKKDVVNRSGFVDPNIPMFMGEYIIPTLLYYFTGNFFVAYWYIPFIFITFLISPAHIFFINLKNNMQILVMMILLFISLFIHRPIDNVNMLHSVMYYAPLYLFGIWCAIRREVIYTFFKGNDLYLLLIAFLLAAIQALVGDVGNYHKQMFVYDGIDLMLLQKITLCLFFMVWLHRFEKKRNVVSSVLAETSFAIFFLHPYLINLIAGLQSTSSIPLDFQSIYYLALIIPVIVVCIISALLAKRILSNRSRYLIGY